MSFTKRYLIISKKNPDSEYDSIEHFWQEHQVESEKSIEFNNRFRAENKLLEQTHTLSTDGKGIIVEKVWADEETYNTCIAESKPVTDGSLLQACNVIEL